MARVPSAYLGQNHQTHERERNWNSCRSPPHWRVVSRVWSRDFRLWFHIGDRQGQPTRLPVGPPQTKASSRHRRGAQAAFESSGAVCSPLERLLRRVASEYREKPRLGRAHLGPGCPGAVSAAPPHLRSRFTVVTDHFCQTFTGFWRSSDNCP